MQGVQTENTTDAGGGVNVGYIDYGDWMEYKINVPSSGTYELKLRLATPSISNPQFQVKNGNNVLATVNVPNTGGFQVWQTHSIMVNLPSGNQTIRLLSTGGGYWNINWMEFAMPATFTRRASSEEVRELKSAVRVFPNPVNETTTLELNNETEGPVRVDIIGMNGKVLKQYNFNKGVRTSRHILSLSELKAGTYMLRVQQNGKVETVKLLKF
jgi:endoglucanase